MQKAPKQREGVEEVVVVARVVARFHGYAIGVHGTLARDIDLIACPWRDDRYVSTPAELAEAIRGAVGGFWGPDTGDEHDLVHTGSRPNAKAHGRLAFSIHGVLGRYIDLSVMPRVEA